MEQLIQLIWDFRGMDALKTAEHQEIHLKEYIQIEKLDIKTTGFQAINDVHAITYIVVTAEQMRQLRDVLKPHRGVYWEDKK